MARPVKDAASRPKKICSKCGAEFATLPSKPRDHICSACRHRARPVDLEKRRAQGRASYQRNKANHQACARAWQAKNRGRVKEQRREYGKRTKEAQKSRHLAWRIKNREKINAANKAARRAAPEKINAWYREYQRKRTAEDVLFKIRMRLRTRLYCAIRDAKAGSAVRDLGCSIAEFKEYIASKFAPGMTWDNWGEWHLDHIKPLVKFDLTVREQLLEACHWSNYQPLWAVDNIRKGARDGWLAGASPML